MYQQNRPQMPMPGMMKGVSPLSGLTDGDEIMAEEQRMGRQPASQAEQMLQQSSPASDKYRMDMFQKIFDEDTRQRLQDGYKDLREYSEEQDEKLREKRQRRFNQLVPRYFPGTH
jgi:hypothetical protein